MFFRTLYAKKGTAVLLLRILNSRRLPTPVCLPRRVTTHRLNNKFTTKRISTTGFIRPNNSVRGLFPRSIAPNFYHISRTYRIHPRRYLQPLRRHAAVTTAGVFRPTTFYFAIIMCSRAIDEIMLSFRCSCCCSCFFFVVPCRVSIFFLFYLTRKVKMHKTLYSNIIECTAFCDEPT